MREAGIYACLRKEYYICILVLRLLDIDDDDESQIYFKILKF